MNDSLIKIDILDLKVRELSKLCSCFSGCDYGCPFYNPDGKDGHAACHIAALLDEFIPKKKLEIDVEICDAGMFREDDSNNNDMVKQSQMERHINALENDNNRLQDENDDLRTLVKVLLKEVKNNGN